MNLAAGRPTRQSSLAHGGEPSRGVDGNTSGVWAEGSVTHTAGEFQPWWEVELGAAELIDEIVVWNRTDCCTGRLSDFRVLVSEQPFGSRSLAQLEADPAVWSTSIAALVGPSETVTVGRVGRHVRIQLVGTDPLSLAEVQVIG